MTQQAATRVRDSSLAARGHNALQARAAPRIALLGPYASRNLGDTATQLAVIENLRRRLPDAQIVGLSPEPEDTLMTLGIPSFPLSARGAASGSLAHEVDPAPRAQGRLPRALHMLRRSDAFARTLDLLVVSGGGQLDDFWGGPWGHPWAMLHWTALARRHSARVAFLGVGLDRLSARLSRQFSLCALRLASYRTFRDQGTLLAMQQLGLRAESAVCPDLAFALSVNGAMRPASARFAVISPISRKTWSHTEDARHDHYMQALCDAGQWLTRRGLRLHIACSQPFMDGQVAALLVRMLTDCGVRDIRVCNTDTVEAFIDQVRGAELVIAARLHGVILSLVAGAPVLALAPLPKVSQVMSDAGLADFCLQLQQLDRGQLLNRAAQALERAGELRLQIARVNARFRAQLQRTFDEVAALAQVPRPQVPRRN